MVNRMFGLMETNRFCSLRAEADWAEFEKKNRIRPESKKESRVHSVFKIIFDKSKMQILYLNRLFS